jgi:hypothetical protein
MAMGGGKHMLPVKAEIREAIGKDVGDLVTVNLDEGIESAKLARSAAPPERKFLGTRITILTDSPLVTYPHAEPHA